MRQSLQFLKLYTPTPHPRFSQENSILCETDEKSLAKTYSDDLMEVSFFLSFEKYRVRCLSASAVVPYAPRQRSLHCCNHRPNRFWKTDPCDYHHHCSTTNPLAAVSLVGVVVMLAYVAVPASLYVEVVDPLTRDQTIRQLSSLLVFLFPRQLDYHPPPPRNHQSRSKMKKGPYDYYRHCFPTSMMMRMTLPPAVFFAMRAVPVAFALEAPFVGACGWQVDDGANHFVSEQNINPK